MLQDATEDDTDLVGGAGVWDWWYSEEERG